MKKLHLATIIGARPQFIKASVLSRKILEDKDLQETIIHTGQHYDSNMSDIFFEELQIPKPSYNLALGGLSHGAMTGRMLEGIESILKQQKPNGVIVYGDTDSTLAGALAGVKLHIPIIHIEAGLRSFNNKMPEEINRILTDRISTLLFAPTQAAVENLKKEGFLQFDCKIVESGDVMYDVALHYSKMAKLPSLPTTFKTNQPFALCTLHRAENTDNKERLVEIFKALNAIAKHQAIILPLHPRTKQVLQSASIDTSSLLIIPPVSYLEMIGLLQHCSVVLTDSGGLQKEAYFFKKPCVTLRDETEWVELLECGYNALAGAKYDTIYECFLKAINDPVPFNRALYGGGNATSVILETIKKELR